MVCFSVWEKPQCELSVGYVKFHGQRQRNFEKKKSAEVNLRFDQLFCTPTTTLPIFKLKKLRAHQQLETTQARMAHAKKKKIMPTCQELDVIAIYVTSMNLTHSLMAC